MGTRYWKILSTLQTIWRHWECLFQALISKTSTRGVVHSFRNYNNKQHVCWLFFSFWRSCPLWITPPAVPRRLRNACYERVSRATKHSAPFSPAEALKWAQWVDDSCHTGAGAMPRARGWETPPYGHRDRDRGVADSVKIIISVQSHHLFHINEIFNEVPNCRLISPSLISTGEIYCIGGSTQLQLEARQAAGE